MMLLEIKHRDVLNSFKVAKEQAHASAAAARQAESNAVQALAEATTLRDQLAKSTNSELPSTSSQSPSPRSGLATQSPASTTSSGGTKKEHYGDSASTSASAQSSLAPNATVITTPKAQTQRKFLRNQWPESHKYFSKYAVFQGMPCSVVAPNSSVLMHVLARAGTTKFGPHPPQSCPLAAVNYHDFKRSVQSVQFQPPQSDVFNLDDSFANSASTQDLPVPPDVAKVSEL